MIAGHYATALVPEKTPSAAQLAFFLTASQLPDLAWFGLTFLGLEPVHTHAGPAHLELIVTHDLLPTLPWLVVAALAGRAFFGHTEADQHEIITGLLERFAIPAFE